MQKSNRGAARNWHGTRHDRGGLRHVNFHDAGRPNASTLLAAIQNIGRSSIRTEGCPDWFIKRAQADGDRNRTERRSTVNEVGEQHINSVCTIGNHQNLISAGALTQVAGAWDRDDSGDRAAGNVYSSYPASWLTGHRCGRHCDEGSRIVRPHEETFRCSGQAYRTGGTLGGVVHDCYGVIAGTEHQRAIFFRTQGHHSRI